jgi:flagellar assembly protein FliH
MSSRPAGHGAGNGAGHGTGNGAEAAFAQTFRYAPSPSGAGNAAAPQWTPPVAGTFSPSDAADELEQVRQQAFADGVASARRENELQTAKLREQVAKVLREFAGERQSYFAKVEEQVVHLALAIVRKILHRESQMDPLLLAGVVHVALERLNSGSVVRLRANPLELQKWSRCFEAGEATPKVELVADVSLEADHCVLETELGRTDIGLETQLKEIEHGFLDLLAQRPERT